MDLAPRLAGGLPQAVHRVEQRRSVRRRGVERVEQNRLGHLAGAALRHDEPRSVPREHEVEVGVLGDRGCGERHEVRPAARQAAPGDGSVERQVGDVHRGGCGHERQALEVGVLACAVHGDRDLGLPAEALGKQGSKRAVDQSADEDLAPVLAGLATEEVAGDAHGRSHLLAVVHRQREERGLRVVLGADHRAEQERPPRSHDHRAVRLAGDAAGLELDRGFADLDGLGVHSHQRTAPSARSVSISS